ncbi:MAG: ABC transporter substrate-binding protein [Chloroflexi bacterium]|nr:ABC transporter substrate-binding protein [Chloroflexota bacterium]
MKINRLLLVSILMLSLLGAPLFAQEEMNEPDLRVGGLPVSNGIPSALALLLGYFEEAGFAVELVPAASAQELRELMEAGELDGFQADLITTLVLIENGLDLRLVRHVEMTNHPDFAIVANAASGIESAEELPGASIAISTRTVVQYLADQLLASAGVSPDEVEYVNVPWIFSRYEMLQQGEVDVALLPQPFLAHAVIAGHHVLVDDSAAAYVPEAISFSTAALAEKGDAVRAFLDVYERVLEITNAYEDRESASEEWYNAQLQAQVFAGLMRLQATTDPALVDALVQYVTLHDTSGIWIHLSTAAVPTEEEFAHAQDWALAAGLVSETREYENVIDGSFLPEMMEEE